MSGITHFTTQALYTETVNEAENNAVAGNLLGESVYLYDTSGPYEPFDTLCEMKGENSPQHDTFVTLCNEAMVNLADEPLLWYVMLEKHFGKETLMARVGLNN